MPAAAAAPPSTPGVSTENWDTVFAVTLDQVNADIVKANKTPPNIDTAPYGQFQTRVKADFGHWRVTEGGDTQTLYLSIPMKNLVCKTVANNTPYTTTCDSCEAVFAIKLELMPHQGPATKPDGTALPPPKSGTTRHALKPRIKSTNPKDPVAVFKQMTWLAPQVGVDAEDPLSDAMENWCQNNLGLFDHVFAFIDINDRVATGDFAFCAPVHSTYAYVDRIQGPGLLGILCMTSGDPMPTAAALSPEAVPAGSGAAFVIAPQRFLLDMVAPSLTKIWPNLATTDLELDTNKKVLRLKSNLRINLPKTTDPKSGQSFLPILTNLTVSLEGDEVMVETLVEAETDPGLYATSLSTNWYRIGLGKNKKGAQTLVYAPSRKIAPVKGHWVDPARATAGKVLTGAEIVFGVLALLADGEGAIILGALLLTCLAGSLNMSNAVEAAQEDPPDISALHDAFTGPFTWTDTDLTLTKGGLAESLQLVGNFA
ncbi:TULIP family P47-like protein [Aliiruegeria sabulilitoris]|uniref:TULIP family P47-like protein n=1 Tax=Aliiruegeria sabulilitoris TaxID=1510458 RepID=UPI00082AF376|nr:TULIP family P47-like protein [Aliiruegeria sabulilitoris]NDR56713.1 hypothetical protein [Pseudoruegeria sp. M32A2M]